MKMLILCIICSGLLFSSLNHGSSAAPDINQIKNDLINKVIVLVSKEIKLDSSHINKMKLIDRAETNDMATYDVEIKTMCNTMAGKIKPLYLRMLLAYEKKNNHWQYIQHKTILKQIDFVR